MPIAIEVTDPATDTVAVAVALTGDGRATVSVGVTVYPAPIVAPCPTAQTSVGSKVIPVTTPIELIVAIPTAVVVGLTVPVPSPTEIDGCEEYALPPVEIATLLLSSADPRSYAVTAPPTRPIVAAALENPG